MLFAWEITGCHFPIHQLPQWWDNKIKCSHHPVWRLFKWLTTLCRLNSEDPEQQNHFHFVGGIVLKAKYQTGHILSKAFLVLVHRYLWPSHLSLFAFLLSDAPAARTQSRAAAKQPNDWQLVVTDCSVYSSIFYPATTFHVAVCFKAKLFSKVQICPLYLYIFSFCLLIM